MSHYLFFAFIALTNKSQLQITNVYFKHYYVNLKEKRPSSNFVFLIHLAGTSMDSDKMNYEHIPKATV